MTAFTPPVRGGTGRFAARPRIQPLLMEKTHQSPMAFNQNAKPSVTLEAGRFTGTPYYGDGAAAPQRQDNACKRCRKLTLKLCIEATTAAPPDHAHLVIAAI